MHGAARSEIDLSPHNQCKHISYIMKDLQTMCADAYLDELGDRPDLIQVIIGERAIERLEHRMKKKFRKEAKQEVRQELGDDLSDLVPELIGQLIELHRGEPALVQNFYDIYPGVPKKTLECAWSIAERAVRSLRTELFFPPHRNL